MPKPKEIQFKDQMTASGNYDEVVTLENVISNKMISGSRIYGGCKLSNLFIDGGITFSPSGYLKGGQSDYNTGIGFWLGYSGILYKFSIGDPAGDHLKWDGSNLYINDSRVQNGNVFGDGSDGDVTIGADTTLTRDMYYDDLTITAGKILTTDGYRVFVKGTLTIGTGAKIRVYNTPTGNNGANAVGIAGGAGGTGQASRTNELIVYLASMAGGAGGNAGSSSVGVAGTAGTAGTAVDVCVNGGNGKAGVSGGGGGGGAAGGGGGAAGVGTERNGSRIISPFAGVTISGTTIYRLIYKAGSGGSGGGGGGSQGGGTGVGGAGGGGGASGCGTGTLVLCARTITGTGSIEAKGGAGGNGGNGSDATVGSQPNGGGGGGGAGSGGSGGLIYLAYSSKATTVTTDVSGGVAGTIGTKGLGANGGDDGVDGSAGNAGYDGLVISLIV